MPVARALGSVALLMAAVLLSLGQVWGWLLVAAMAIMIFLDAAFARSALADEIGILTVPSTVIVDTAHSIRTVNLGIRSRNVLAKQVLDLAASA